MATKSDFFDQGPDKEEQYKKDLVYRELTLEVEEHNIQANKRNHTRKDKPRFIWSERLEKFEDV